MIVFIKNGIGRFEMIILFFLNKKWKAIDSIKIEMTMEYRGADSYEYEYLQNYETTIILRR